MRPVRALTSWLGSMRTRLHLRRTREVFDTWAQDGRDSGMERGHGPVARRILSRLHLPRDGTFLDIGCGNGYAVRWAARHAPDGWAVGIDLSPRMIQRARELSSDLDNVRFEVTAFPEHPLLPASFDAIFSMEVFYYFPDLRHALEATRDLLKPGGKFACAVDFYEENEASHGWTGYVDAYMRLMSQDEWKAALDEAGFARVRQERVVVPEEEATEEWHSTVGSLVTWGRRPS